MTRNVTTAEQLARRIGVFLLFLTGGLVVFVIFSHYFPVLPAAADMVGRGVVGVVLLSAALDAREKERLRRYWPVLFAFFAALAAISIDYYLSLSRWILPALGLSDESPAGMAVDKLGSSLLSIGIVVVLVRTSGESLGALYLRKGRLWVGLIVGLAAFVLMIVTVIPVSQTFFGGQDLRWGRIVRWAPWILVFVLANAFNEELLFRGLFFGRVEPCLGTFGTNLVMTIPFVLMHTGVTYASDVLVFAGMLVPLSLAWGYVLQKTNSLWGSFLFHAAMDIPVVVGILSSLEQG